MRSSTIFAALVSFCAVQSGQAWSTPKTGSASPQVSRKSMLQTLVQGGVATAAATFLVEQPVWAVEKLPSGVTYEVIKKGTGIKPDVGELVAIRFAAYADGRKIDDIFDSPEPYYTRVGSGGLLKGVESALPNMVLGDRWKLFIPVRKHIVIIYTYTYIYIRLVGCWSYFIMRRRLLDPIIKRHKT